MPPFGSSRGHVELDVDVALDRVGVWADGMGRLDDVFGLGLTETRDRDVERHSEIETALAVGHQAHLTNNLDVIVAHLIGLRPGHVDDRVFKASGITGGEKLFRIGRATLAAQLLGHCERQVENAIVALDDAAAAADGGNFRGVKMAHDRLPHHSMPPDCCPVRPGVYGFTTSTAFRRRSTPSTDAMPGPPSTNAMMPARYRRSVS